MPRVKLNRPQILWRWFLLSPLVLGLAFFGVRGANLRSAPGGAPPVQALPVATTVLKAAKTYAVERTYTGEITARRSSDLGFERSGTVVAVLVDDGDRVSAGAPVARLDTRGLSGPASTIDG